MATIRVPQADGPIVVRRGGAESVERHVKDHLVSVADEDVEHFLAVVDGAKVVEAKPTPAKSD